ncbi:hypothetical protein NQ318_012323 [Aromia moschata]|uniref:ABC transporter domain-containing protein n=1 Tax=Aromia moschata TaxID=1265417 RepID=A0AAV8YKY3_9CUCU|nr:hypothetical protein NQ318_012323 [Aromia moschata]
MQLVLNKDVSKSQNRGTKHAAREGTMGRSLDKFLLLMWKNWTLQYRKPIQTLVEIFAPIIFSILLVVIRKLIDPELQNDIVYRPFCTIPHMFRNTSDQLLSNLCPDSEPDEIMEGLEDSDALTRYYAHNGSNVFAAIQFDDNYQNLSSLSDITNLKVALRFPGENRRRIDPFMLNNWMTNLIFPLFQTAGPRQYNLTTGAAPSYYSEGFLAIQQFLTLSVILAKNDISPNDNISLISWFLSNHPPMIEMRRFPHASWYEDPLLLALQSMIGIIMMLSFVYTCINTVKNITTEKEKQLKEAMKIMGLPNWLHWTAWYLKTFLFLLLSAILIVVLLKVRWYSTSDFTVFTNSDPFVIFVFLLFYMSATVTFCFAISVFFSKANTAATVAGMVWFFSYSPYLFMQQKYDTLSLAAKLLASLGSNSAMAFGFQLMLMYEGTGEGVQWDNVLKPNTPDDSLTLGLVWLMLAVDSIIYLLIALYFEAIFPGEYGVAKPWYFPFTASYWCGQRYIGVEDLNGDIKMANQGEFFEEEPQNLRTGIEIKNLRKEFGKNAAVRNLSLNMYVDQITVLLGHNGAGKTTTMSMLTGLLTPNSGTAKVNGHDIRTNMAGVRSSLGLCPQHNIIFDDMTVEEHLYFYGKLKDLSKAEIKHEIDKYIRLLELEPKRKAKAASLSGGMKRKLCVGIALCGNSKVVMLDEPTAGMDPSARRALWDLLQEQKEGRTMLLTTHFMDEADLLGDRIAIMAGGELQCCGSSFFLKKKYGAGYSLVMEKDKNCDVSQVTSLLKRHIPDTEVHSNVGSELTYLLAENQSPLFEPMLRELENNSSRIVGADHGQEEIYNDLPATNGVHDHIIHNNHDLNGDAKINIEVKKSFTGGWGLLNNQFMAMLLKKILSNMRSWILLCIQILMPVLFLIIAIVVARSNQQMGDLPAMPLSLDKFDNPVTLTEKINDNFDYTDDYKKVLTDEGHRVEDANNMTQRMIQLSGTVPITVRRRYIAGASFDIGTMFDVEVPSITAWFNNDPYHSPGITLGLVLKAMYRKLLSCPNCELEFTNYPMPFTADTQITQLVNGQNMGFQLAFNMAFSMAFVSSFYVLFVVRENMCKSKHLQFVSGVKVYVFWITSVLCDMITYMVTVVALLLTLLCFQEDGFNTASEIGRLFFILFYFGWAFLPMLYLAGYIFEIPSTGYTRMTLFSIFTGVAAFLVVQVLSNDSLDLKYIADALHWVFLVFPHYSLATGIMDTYKMYALVDICSQFNSTIPDSYNSVCDGVDGNYFKWESPGIGRNIVYSFLGGIILFILLLTIDYGVYSRITDYISNMRLPPRPADPDNEDDDVAEEKQRIRNATDYEIRNNNVLVLRDLTKFYKKFQAVNSLCLGVNSYECFGLLGVNGAGKTTTFKMMTGDVKPSYGDAWVYGFSIRRELKEVQRGIGYCPQFDALLDDMTAKETITMFALLRGIRYSDCVIVAENLAREFDFTRHLNKRVKELSGGNKRKLSTAISLIGDPPVIYLDEPTTGMDPATKRYLWNALCKIRDNGKCVVLTSHSMEECEALCTRLAIMVNGNFKCLGSTQHLKHKFAEGYMLTIKIKKEDATYEADLERIESFIRQHFPDAKLREKHQELVNYYITDRTRPWSKMFGILEEGKRNNPSIEDYSLGQSSLEQLILCMYNYLITTICVNNLSQIK